ncbi:MAG: hypothetical protein IPG55_06735 [Saprospiraceae bacterium]|nr:hypothetical protein [Candidatus Defluviibacterium haderslevense]
MRERESFVHVISTLSNNLQGWEGIYGQGNEFQCVISTLSNIQILPEPMPVCETFQCACLVEVFTKRDHFYAIK